MAAESVINGVDYGPLAGLLGRWYGDDGMDVSPEPDDTEHNPYYETIVYEPADDVDNAETQELAVVRYHQLVSRKRNNKVFHNESGYWMWDAEQDLLMLAFSIPRGVSLVAGGRAAREDGAVTLQVRAAADDPDWPIAQSPFMRDNAATLAFERSVRITGGQLAYTQTTLLDIYGRRFDHTDENTLQPQSG